MPQLKMFTEVPTPETIRWEQLGIEQKQIVIEALSRLLIKAIQLEKPKESARNE
jgi:hypothetical protein